MTGTQDTNQSIRIEGNAVGSTIVAGNGNVIYVTQQTIERRVETVTPNQLTQLGPNPYKGLSAFKESDADRYFGREAQVKRLWQRFQDLYEQSSQPRLLPVLGPSGCGKSSLARAGLIPELTRRPLPGKDQMRVVTLVPGDRPLKTLANVLAKTVTNDPLPLAKSIEIEQLLLTKSGPNQYEGLYEIAGLIPDIRDTPLVILVDQFEEVYSLCKEPDQQKAFVNNLLYAASTPTKEISVVIVLRSDFVGETQRHEQLNQLVGSDQSMIVPAMTETELRRAIAIPAEQAGHVFEPAMVNLLVNDARDREGVLPLLQFALTRLWEGLQVGEAPSRTYEAMGGVGGALAGKAQEIYDKLDDKTKQDIARRVFLGLVQPGEGTRDTRRRATVTSLVANCDSREEVEQVIHRFSSLGARLITLSSVEGEEMAEVTHEAIFQHWQLLSSWIDQSRNDLRFQRRLEAAATYWDKQGQPVGLLWRTPDLDLLRSFQNKARSEMTPLQIAFFEASAKAEKRAKQIKRLGYTGLVVGLALTTTLSAVASYNVHRAGRRQMRVYQETSRALTNTDATSSLVNGLAAIGLGQSAFLRFPRLNQASLVSAEILGYPNRVARFRYLIEFPGVFDEGEDDNNDDGRISEAFSSDSQLIVIGSRDGTVRLFDIQGNPIGSPFRSHSDSVLAVAISPDGQTIASGDSRGTIQLWDMQGNPIGGPFEEHLPRPISAIDISQDGQTIASSDFGGTIRVWDRQGKPIAVVEHSGAVSEVKISPDGQTIAGVGDVVRLWDLAGNPVGQPFDGVLDSEGSIAFSPDSQTIASGHGDGTVRLWDLQGNPVGEPFRGHIDMVHAVAFSPDGQFIASGSSDSTVRLWDLQGNLVHRPLEGHTDFVRTVAFSSDGNLFSAGGGQDNTIRIWAYEGYPRGKLLQKHSEGISSVMFSADGQTIAASSQDGVVWLWDTQGNLVASTPIQTANGQVTLMTLSPDGRAVVGRSNTGTLWLWNLVRNSLVDFSNYEEEITSAAFSPDGQTLATGSREGAVQIWQLQANPPQPLGESFRIHDNDEITAISFHSNNQTLVTGSRNRSIQTWDLQGNPLTNLFQIHEPDIIRSVAFHSDSHIKVGVGGGQSEVALQVWGQEGGYAWDLIDSISQIRLGEPIAFSPDDQMAVSGAENGTVRLWNSQGDLVGEFLGHTGRVTSVTFSSDNRFVASGAEDGTVRLWPIKSDEGWLQYTCERIRGYLSARRDDAGREAHRTCDRYAWDLAYD